MYENEQKCKHTYCIGGGCYLAWTLNYNPNALQNLTKEKRFEKCPELHRYKSIAKIMSHKQINIFSLRITLPF